MMSRRSIPGAGAAGLSDAARELRTAMRWLLFLALGCVVLAFGTGRGWLPPEALPLLVALFFMAAAGALWLGLRTHRQALADRERSSRLSLIITIAAQLGKQDDDTLARIAGTSGPAGEAARMILTERRQRRSRPATPSVTP